ncbi:MAG: SulP family inorganic anion transporter, partial [Proteobacteria bacterium]|nr:SulP family inorganic anion transporter [Pseudomonadota bacterium]
MFRYPRQDVPAGVVVFLVAVPLCLGLAMASGAPPLSGLVAGVVGGVLVPFLSPAPLAVTGPAAGLVSIVLLQTKVLGGFDRLLAAAIIMGVLQILLGLLRTGRLAARVPESVVQGMLAAIGMTIIWSELPVMIGAKSGTALTASDFAMGPTLVAAVTLCILYGWRAVPLADRAWLPPTLIAVVAGTLLAQAFAHFPAVALHHQHFVQLPLGGWSAIRQALPRPDLTALADPVVWRVGLILAMVGSIETVLSLRAMDAVDPLQRTSPPNRELMAQGAANIVSGLLGGLPMSVVVVRSAANLQAGGRQRLSALLQGVLLLLAVLFADQLLDLMPLACLSALLVTIGLRLASPALFAQHAKAGWRVFVPFA